MSTHKPLRTNWIGANIAKIVQIRKFISLFTSTFYMYNKKALHGKNANHWQSAAWQYVMFYLAKSGLSDGKRRHIGMQYGIFWQTTTSWMANQLNPPEVKKIKMTGITKARLVKAGPLMYHQAMPWGMAYIAIQRLNLSEIITDTKHPIAILYRQVS